MPSRPNLQTLSVLRRIVPQAAIVDAPTVMCGKPFRADPAVYAQTAHCSTIAESQYAFARSFKLTAQFPPRAPFGPQRSICSHIERQNDELDRRKSTDHKPVAAK